MHSAAMNSTPMAAIEPDRYCCLLYKISARVFYQTLTVSSNIQRLTKNLVEDRCLDWTAFSYSVKSGDMLKSTWGKIKGIN
jgi:hypothetical protein